MTETPARPEPSLPEATISRLLTAIERRTGLSRDAGLAGRLDRALRTQNAAGLYALATRLETLPWHSPDWQQLITGLLVHETYFFRDWPQLEHLAQNGLPDRIAEAAANGDRTLRIWSAGCASGEEAYTLAVVTLNAMARAGAAIEYGDTMVPQSGWRLEVIGSDISRDMVDQADRGIYSTSGLSPFRAMRDGYGRFFPSCGPGARAVRADLRARLRFVQDNLLDGPPPITRADAVVCRNVLVYFAEVARHEALAKLTAALGPGGYLLLGPTDPRPPPELFDTLWSSGPAIYRRRLSPSP